MHDGAVDDDRSCKSQDSESRTDWQVLLVKLITGKLRSTTCYKLQQFLFYKKKNLL